MIILLERLEQRGCGKGRHLRQTPFDLLRKADGMLFLVYALCSPLIFRSVPDPLRCNWLNGWGIV